jgi:hypothetical protein
MVFDMSKRLLGGVLLALALLAGCADRQSGAATASGASVSAPSASASAPCQLVPSSASASCEVRVQRLNDALGQALAEVLPPDASVSSNMFLESGTALGVTFFPRRDQDGSDGYEAALRVKLGDRVGTLDIGVHSYTAVPTSAPCPSQARLRDMQSKGVQQGRCDWRKSGGAVVHVNAESDPYGSGEFADMAIQHLAVTVYRGDGVRMDVMLSPAVESVPSDPAERQKIVQNILTVDQLEKIAFNTSFTLS